MLTKESMRQFTGTECYHRFSFYNWILATDGVIHVAKEGAAFWLLEAIAGQLVFNEKLYMCHPEVHMQFWKLQRNGNEWLLTCRLDSNQEPLFTEVIPYSDFPLSEIDLWVGISEINERPVWVIMLPSEY